MLYIDCLLKFSITHYLLLLTNFLQRKVQNNMFMAPTDQHEIIKLIDSLKPMNSSGHDNITSALIKDIKHEIAIPLTILFNKSIHGGRVPDDIKLAKVIPIYKAKYKELLNNCRPISGHILTSHCI